MKKEKGITLVALVITIVVLIILAGVAINLSLGENGIFNKAKQAKRMQMEAEYKEKIGTDLLAAQVDAITRNEELEDAQIKDIISNYGELQEDGDTIKIKDSDIEVSLSDIYKGTTTSNGSYTESKAKIAMLEKRVKELQEQLDNLSLSGDEKDKKITELNNKITELQDEMNKAKKDLAEALTKKGTETSSDASFDTIISNLNNMSGTYSEMTRIANPYASSGYINVNVSKEYDACLIYYRRTGTSTSPTIRSTNGKIFEFGDEWSYKDGTNAIPVINNIAIVSGIKEKGTSIQIALNVNGFVQAYVYGLKM